MKIDNIKATNIELTQPIVDYVVKRVEALEKFINKEDESVRATVTNAAFRSTTSPVMSCGILAQRSWSTSSRAASGVRTTKIMPS